MRTISAYELTHVGGGSNANEDTVIIMGHRTQISHSAWFAFQSMMEFVGTAASVACKLSKHPVACGVSTVAMVVSNGMQMLGPDEGKGVYDPKNWNMDWLRRQEWDWFKGPRI
jgi:hypothetical protein